jgi:cytoskeleton protein RodZ
VDAHELLRRYEAAVMPGGPVSTPLPLSQTNATIFRVQPSGRSHAGLGIGVGVVIVILLALGWMRGNQLPVETASAPATKKQVAANKSTEARRPATAEPPRVAEQAPVATAPTTPQAADAASGAAPAAAPQPDPAPSPVLPASTQLRLEMQANEQSWVQAQVDGAEMREALLQPGERLLWTAVDAIEVTLGNAGGMTLVVNGEPVAPLGEVGQVIHLRVTKDRVEKIKRSRPAPRPESMTPSTLAF